MPESATDAHRAQLEALVKPFRDQLAQVEAEITQKDSELRELKEWRTKLTRMLAPLDPDRPKPGPKTNRAGRPNYEKVNEETLAAIEQYIRDTYSADDEPFYAGGIARREDFTIASEATVRNALLTLADRGVLRLDSITRKGGAKMYRFTDGGTK